MPAPDHILFRYSLKGLQPDVYGHYVMHALCRQGSCAFTYNGQKRKIHAGDLLIQACHLFSDFEQSDDFLVEVILISPHYTFSAKELDYAVKAQMELFLNPVIHLTSEQMLVCRANFHYVSYRLLHPEHKFQREALSYATQTMLLDIFDIHSQRRGKPEASTRYTELLKNFVDLLEAGEYLQHRDADYYASKLFVSTKHLSFVTRRMTGFSATYWINRYLQIDIRKQLAKRELSIKQLANRYNFSTPSYFCRYIEKNLGIAPTALRK